MKAGFVPNFDGELRNHILKVPEEIYSCSGMIIFGRRIKSLIFTTDLAIIRNSNADGVLAVYPFTPQPVISQALIHAADTPVFTGVGGGTTRGIRCVELAKFVEHQGATGVVVNAPTEPKVIEQIRNSVDIPIISTVLSFDEKIADKLKAGVSILNVSAASKTPEVVERIRDKYPEVPILATGGPTGETVKATVAAGANVISWTPPSAAEIFKSIMTKYRTENF